MDVKLQLSGSYPALMNILLQKFALVEERKLVQVAHLFYCISLGWLGRLAWLAGNLAQFEILLRQVAN